MTSKNDVLTSILTFFHQKPSRSGTLLTSTPFLRFYCFYRPLEHRRSPALPWCAVRCGASQHIPVSLRSQAVKSRGGRVLIGACSLTLSKCIDVATPFWADIWNCSALLPTCQIPGEVSLHLRKARSKLNGSCYLQTSRTPVN
jgi:hypothetical protein